MLQIFLAVLIWVFAPTPWLFTAIHIFTLKRWWDFHRIRIFLLIFFLCVWAVLAFLLKTNFQIIFMQQFSTSISMYFGIAILCVSAGIEIFTELALGRKRILGSSELNKSNDKLITTGIYKYARHPRYIEHPLFFIGLGLVLGYTSLLWFALYLFISFAITAYFEEKELIQRYGEEYLKYREKTPAFFIGGKNLTR